MAQRRWSSGARRGETNEYGEPSEAIDENKREALRAKRYRRFVGKLGAEEAA
jgi:hypothetical protein